MYSHADCHQEDHKGGKEEHKSCIKIFQNSMARVKIETIDCAGQAVEHCEKVSLLNPIIEGKLQQSKVIIAARPMQRP